ncbi:hypothetical protein TURU_004885 [Turdus rufiventris]|nr:hypothetical protein TURU_004885 [Turdus rufiventris]
MPSPAMLPQNWNLAVVDMKDCFFKIPSDPVNAPQFAFSVPTTNQETPRRRLHRFLFAGGEGSKDAFLEVFGLEITAWTTVPQKLAFNSDTKTVTDLHSLCGTLNRIRPWLGITTDELSPLFNLLKGGEELSSPRSLTPEAKIALEKVETALAERQSHWNKLDLNCHSNLLCWGSCHTSTD